MDKKHISVFLASPGDVSNERQTFRDVIDVLNSGFAEGADVILEPLGWEDSLATTGRRCQSVINENIDRCDIFIILLHMRWGQEVEKDNPYSSYTEEEFHRAYSRLKSDNPPEIYVFFKDIDDKYIQHPDDQLQNVIKFKKQLISMNNVLFRQINETSFLGEITKHLKEYIKGRRSTNHNYDHIVFPVDAIDKVEKLEKDKKKFEQNYAVDSFKFAQLGHKDVKNRFIKISKEFDSAESLLIAFDYFFIIADYFNAEETLNRFNTFKTDKVIKNKLGYYYLNIARLLNLKGDFKSFRSCVENSLSLFRGINDTHGIASCLLEMGNIYEHIGLLDEAEKFYLDSLNIFENSHDISNIGRCYVNLSDIYFTKGEHDTCIKFINHALSLFLESSDLEGQILVYEKLGNIEATKDKNKAKVHFLKSLDFSKQLNYKAGIAAQNINLGNLLVDTNDYPKARKYYNDALEIYKTLNDLYHIGITYGAISNILFYNDEFDECKILNEKAIEIFNDINSEKALLKSIYNHATFYFKLGMGSDALVLIDQYLPRFLNLKFKQGLATLFMLKGHILLNDYHYIKNNELINNAEKELITSYNLFDELVDYKGLFNTSGLLILLYELKKDRINTEKFKKINKNIPNEFRC